MCVCVFFISLQVISQVVYFEDERDDEDAIHWIDNIIPFGYEKRKLSVRMG